MFFLTSHYTKKCQAGMRSQTPYTPCYIVHDISHLKQRVPHVSASITENCKLPKAHLCISYDSIVSEYFPKPNRYNSLCNEDAVSFLQSRKEAVKYTGTYANI
jgi:hypothetical protein